jgi:hypothetical protein
MSKQYTNLTGQAVAFDLTTASKPARKTTSILSRRTLRSQRRLTRAL